tara:strand:- start:34415 stop:34927 length:513 start_codon:yes stop_codon:yes gene_type:complete
MTGNPVILAIAGIAFAVLLYLFIESRKRAKGLLNALYEEQALKNDLAQREKERNEEFLFMMTQSVSLLKDLVKQFYRGEIVIEGVGYEYKEDLSAIVQVLSETPTNYLNKNVGHYELSIDEGDFNGLEILLTKAPKLRNVRYIQLIIIVRIMISQKVDLKSAYSMWEASL